MALALAEARAAGVVSPNPAVGCAIVRDGAVVGRGHTLPPGQAHAEVQALADAGGAARGADVYVTLEPCSHWGRTGPCADALIAAGVRRVVVALVDPDPNVGGEGLMRLRAAGVEVETGDGAVQASRQLEAYLRHRVSGRPLVIAKFAVSLDGRIATRTGDSMWISGPEARARTRQDRTRFDAILVGSGTVVADDPQLTAREQSGDRAKRQPLRVVLDSRGRTPPTARVLSHEAPTLIATLETSPPEWREAIAAHDAMIEICPSENGRVALEPLLGCLAQRGVLSLLVEGGAEIHGSFFDQGLVDRVLAVVSPLVIGGREAPLAVAGIGPAALSDAWRLEEVEVETAGVDLFVTGRTRRLMELLEQSVVRRN